MFTTYIRRFVPCKEKTFSILDRQLFSLSLGSSYFINLCNHVTSCIVSLIDQTWEICYYIGRANALPAAEYFMTFIVHWRVSILNREFFLWCFMHPLTLCTSLHFTLYCVNSFGSAHSDKTCSILQYATFTTICYT